MNSATFWLLFNFTAIIISAFYSMAEMACVTLNKVRLHYHVSRKEKRALWLNYLLQHPFRLFGTTLIGVNVANVVSSECAREFHEAIGLSPDLAPLSQVFLVVLFGELAPMFAARHFPEHVAKLGSPILYASAKVMAPFLWIIGHLVRFVQWMTGKKATGHDIFLSQEELQKILEEHEGGEREDFNRITTNIFLLRKKWASDIMTPLKKLPKLPSNATIAQLRNLIKKTHAEFIPIFHKDINNIIAIAYPRDMIRATDNKRVRDYAKSPWFITKRTHVTEILHQFRRNNESVAVILDAQGKAIGMIELDDLLEEIFGEVGHGKREESTFVLDRTFSGDMLVQDFNKLFSHKLKGEEDYSLSEIMEKELGHQPELGEAVVIGIFELSVEEAGLLGAKSVNVRTLE